MSCVISYGYNHLVCINFIGPLQAPIGELQVSFSFFLLYCLTILTLSSLFSQSLFLSDLPISSLCSHLSHQYHHHLANPNQDQLKVHMQL
ncbi:unnamed protein product [Trifolium pratense]|uniref:Uncharacterized protein n=1 Tax=Trifolium pratense TaxID=57577 RepID=A0ACB0L5S1_TRIPR|nr:unnamed protein product [Trifolium pratense]